MHMPKLAAVLVIPWTVLAAADAPTPNPRLGDELTFAIDAQTRSGNDAWQVGLRIAGPASIPGAEVRLGENTVVVPEAGSLTGSLTDCPVGDSPRFVPIRVTVVDERGVEVGSSIDFVPLDPLRRGFYTAGVVLADYLPRGSDLSPEELAHLQGAMTSGFGAFQCFLGIVERNPELEKLRKSIARGVVRRPGLASLLKMMRGEIREVYTFGEASPETRRVGSSTLPAVRVGFDFELQNRPAMSGEIVAVPSQSPFLGSGGIVELVGRHPSRSERRFRVRLLEAMAGAGPAISPGEDEEH